MQEDLEGFYKKKGFIEECVGKKAVVQLINSKKRAKISEKFLETVIPSEGRPVIVVKGELAKKTGTLKKINQKEFCVVVEGKHCKSINPNSCSGNFKIEMINYFDRDIELPVKYTNRDIISMLAKLI